MSKSRSFDRAASFYDQTRPFLESVARQGTQAILDIVGPGARILEVGAGTGRISIPLLEGGLDLIGCDLSGKMLLRFQEKYPAAPIARADALYLPFPSDSFEAVMTAHVLHLVPEWREALREFVRVLKPGGAYLNLTTWGTVGVSIRDQLRRYWRGWLQDQGIDAFLPGVRSSDEFVQQLRAMGAEVTEVEVMRYPLRFTLREELTRLESRSGSDSWEVPDDLFDASLQELRAWVASEYGDLDYTHEDELRFSIDVARFTG
jgi:SAM-dependent methyltransferase